MYNNCILCLPNEMKVLQGVKLPGIVNSYSMLQVPFLRNDIYPILLSLNFTIKIQGVYVPYKLAITST